MNEIKLDIGGDDGRTIRRKKNDGTWEEVKSEPISENPKVDAMRKLPIGELRRVLEDPDDPRQEAAQEYSKLLGERFSATIASSLSVFNDAIDAIDSNISTSILGDRATSITESQTTKLFDPIDVPALDGLRSPVHDVVEGQQELIERMGQTNEALALLLEQNRTDASEQKQLLTQQIADARNAADEQRDIASDERARGKKALVAAWVAVGVTVIVGIFQIVMA